MIYWAVVALGVLTSILIAAWPVNHDPLRAARWIMTLGTHPRFTEDEQAHVDWIKTLLEG